MQTGAESALDKTMAAVDALMAEARSTILAVHKVSKWFDAWS